MFSKHLSIRIIGALLAAILLMGLGRVALLPPFEGTDESAHYSRIEAAAFAGPFDKAQFISADVMGYYRVGPMPPGWIFNRTLLHPDPALKKGETPAKAYADYRRFFGDPARAGKFAQSYRQEPAPRAYRPTGEENWEFQHPALYYVLMGGILKRLPEMPLAARLLILRTSSFLLAFAGFAIGMVATLRHLQARKNEQARDITACGMFLPFLMPSFFADFGRLGNDSLCLLLFGIAWAALLWHLRRPQETVIWVLLGAIAGYTWLVKGFMIPITLGMLLFMAIRRGDAKKMSYPMFLPAAVALLIAVLIGSGPYLSARQGGLPGSVELNAWLHGSGYAEAEGLPWAKIFLNLLHTLSSSVYTFTDMTLSHIGETAIWAMLAALIAVLIKFFSTLPRDPRAEAWLPLYPALPLAAGLFVHGVLAAIAYRAVGVTPGYYMQVISPALALMLGIGLCQFAQARRGRLFVAGLLAITPPAALLIMAGRLALFTGCAWLSDNDRKFNLDSQGACAPQVIYERLSLLAWPGPGLSCFALAVMLLVAAAVLAVRPLLRRK